MAILEQSYSRRHPFADIARRHGFLLAQVECLPERSATTFTLMRSDVIYRRVILDVEMASCDPRILFESICCEAKAELANRAPSPEALPDWDTARQSTFESQREALVDFALDRPGLGDDPAPWMNRRVSVLEFLSRHGTIEDGAVADAVSIDEPEVDLIYRSFMHER